jgi:2-oxoglutarate dehydrogenase E2 component (dihydrolipoamide succinyltransferase)
LRNLCLSIVFLRINRENQHMALVNIFMPKLGEGIMEATVLRWHKQPGEWVKMDETLLEIATDKVDTEVPSTAEGTLEEVLCKENDVIAIGSVIAKIRTQSATEPEIIQSSSYSPPPFQNDNAETTENIAPAVPYQPLQHEVATNPHAARFYSPLVMNIAASEGIDFNELSTIQGTGNEGRVTKKDVLNYLEKRNSTPAPTDQVSSTPIQTQQLPPLPAQQAPPASVETAKVDLDQLSANENVEIIEMDRMRKMIAEHMTRSLDTSAHVTSFAEADVTNLVKWREKIKGAFEKREGEKITYTPVFIEAIVKSIKQFPLLNASVVGDKILLKKDINIGMATALPNGNLIVPVIKNADQLSTIGLVKQVNRLANNARDGKLQPADTQNGTFTFTNIGTFGSLMGTPIINQPQVAILAVGAIKKKPVVIESEKGDSIAIRHMMFVSMSYDHRVIDGGLGSKFLAAFVKALESFDTNSSF